ncbi:MAG: DUF4340 domain-containing protein, partial [Bacteroidales bacterium]
MTNIIKKNKFLIITTVVLGIVAVWLLTNQRSSKLAGASQDFSVRDTSSITKIFLAKKDESSVILSRGENNRWLVNNDMKASTDAVGILLETLRRIDIRRPVAKAEYDNVIKRLSSIGVKVEIYQKKPLFHLLGIDFFTKERKTKTFYVGDATRDNLGTYMLREGADVPYVVSIPGFRGFLTPRFKAKADKWRDHTMIAEKASEIQAVEIHHPRNPEQSFRLEQSNPDGFVIKRLSDNSRVSPVDTLKVLDFLSSFSSVKYENLINESSHKDSVINSQPLHIIRVTDFEGETKEIKTFRRASTEGKKDIYGNDLAYDVDRLYAWFNKGEDFALIQYYIFDNITRPADYF